MEEDEEHQKMKKMKLYILIDLVMNILIDHKMKDVYMLIQEMMMIKLILSLRQF